MKKEEETAVSFVQKEDSFVAMSVRESKEKQGYFSLVMKHMHMDKFVTSWKRYCN